MPRVKIDYIVSFSSEDPENPASNLLAWDVNKKKWLCSKGEPSCSVVLQLTKAVKICSVNIGAYQSALVEVLVGRSETPNEPFQVLVPKSVFQSPGEARRGAAGDADKVRSFAAEALAAPRAQRWDRLRLVCSQPYNRHCKFGLTFIHVFTEEDSPPAPAPAAPARVAASLDLQPSDDEEFHPGELFAKHLQKPKESSDTGARIRQATSHALKNIPDSSIKLTKVSIAKPSSERDGPPGARAERPPRRPARGAGAHGQRSRDDDTDDHTDNPDGSRKGDRPDASKTQSADEPSEKADRSRKRGRDKDSSSERKDDERSRKNDWPAARVERDDGPSGRGRKDDEPSGRGRKDGGPTGNGKKGDESKKRRHSDKRDDDLSPCVAAGAALRPGPGGRAPHALLRGAVLVLSGYEHPRRARLRAAAAALGAATARDWGPACTHLICAFPNTPKLRAARAAGGAGGAPAVAVRGEWLEQCARARRRLPWQWFATEPAQRVPPPPAWDRGLSECDTDDEIEKVRQKMKRRRSASSSPPRASPSPAPPSPSPADASAGSDVTFVRDERLQGSVTIVDSDSCGGSTDEEAGGGARPRPGRRSRLPAPFAGRCFRVAAPPARAALLARYLRAYGGLVLQDADDPDDEADYVVCEAEHAAAEGRGRGCGRGRGGARVGARWVWRCVAERRLCAPEGAPQQPD